MGSIIGYTKAGIDSLLSTIRTNITNNTNAISANSTAIQNNTSAISANSAAIATKIPVLPLLATATASTALTTGSLQPFNGTAAITNPALPALSGLAVGTTYGCENLTTFPVVTPYASGDTSFSGASALTLSYPGAVTLQVVPNAAGSGKLWKVVEHVRSDASLTAAIVAGSTLTTTAVQTAATLTAGFGSFTLVNPDARQVSGAVTTAGSTTVTASGGAFTAADVGKAVLGFSRTVTDLSSTSGSATVTSSTANFTAADVGSIVTAPGIIGITISSVTNTSTAVLSGNASTTASNLSATIQSQKVIPLGATVASITNSTTAVLSAPATASTVGMLLGFGGTATVSLASGAVSGGTIAVRNVGKVGNVYVVPTGTDTIDQNTKGVLVGYGQIYEAASNGAGNWSTVDGIPVRPQQFSTPLEGNVVNTFGSSYVARYVGRLNSRLGTTTVTDNSAGGTDSAASVLAFANNRTPGTSKGLVVIDNPVNNISTRSQSDAVADRLGYGNDIRTLLRMSQASAWTLNSDASNTYTGSWSTQGSLPVKGGTANKTSTVGDKVSVTNYVGSTIYFMVMAIGAANTSLDVAVTASVGGTNYGTLPSVRVAGTTAGAFSLYAFKVTGMPVASKTVDLTVTSITGGLPFYYNGYLSPLLAKPPATILVKNVPMTNGWAWGGGNYSLSAGNAQLALLNGDLDTIAADPEFGGAANVQVADPNAWGWTPECFGPDLVHPLNPMGGTVFLDAIESAARLFPYRLGYS